jgi:magnesium chelatase family protein
VLPAESAREAALAGGLTIHAADNLLEVVRSLLPGVEAPPPLPLAVAPPRTAGLTLPDLRDVKGQSAAKRALEVAAAGEHSLLMMGPPGTGKSMLAQRFGALLPPLGDAAALESAAVLSLTGVFHPQEWGQRVLRAPHHTASSVALVGGGSPPRPGGHHHRYNSCLRPTKQGLSCTTPKERLASSPKLDCYVVLSLLEIPKVSELTAGFTLADCSHL